MSDYRNLNDPMARERRYDPDTGRGGSAWAWIAGALVVVFVLAIAFGVHRGPRRVAFNNGPPPATSMTPHPSGGLSPAAPPQPAGPLSPTTPAPHTPGHP